MSKTHRVARVLHIRKQSETIARVTIVIGDQEQEIDWPQPWPVAGDAFLAAPGNSPKILEKIGAAAPGAWSVEGDGMRWRRRMADGKTRMEILWKRHAIRRAVRDYLDGEGFIEIDSPLLVHGTTPDAVIHSFRVGDRYLSTSTELQARRLEVGGFERLYTLTQNFRAADGEGNTHNPEFTMLEWGRVGQSLPVIEEDTEQLVWRAHRAIGGDRMHRFRGHEINLEPPWPRIKVIDAIKKYLHVAMPDFSLTSIQHAVQNTNITVHPEWSEDGVFLFSILMDYLQQFLGFEGPIFLCDWPAFQTSSAQAKGSSDMTERSEAFVCGLELCNGFVSLTDYEGQKTAFQKQLDRRRIEGKEQVDLDHAYMEAVRLGLPQDAAMALGFDRLVMILTDRADIRSVLAFAWDEL